MTAWRAKAECAGLDTELFYRQGRCPEAVAVCHTCPVMWQCRYDALEHLDVDQYGVQGGLEAYERKRLRRAWLQIDPSVMRARRAAAYRESCALRGELIAA